MTDQQLRAQRERDRLHLLYLEERERQTASSLKREEIIRFKADTAHRSTTTKNA